MSYTILKNNLSAPCKNFCKPLKKFPRLGENFISSLEMYISSLEMHIFRLDMYISRLEMEFSSGFARFFGGEGKFFHPLGNAGGNVEFCTQVSGVWLVTERFSEKSGRWPIVFRAIRGLTSKSKK